MINAGTETILNQHRHSTHFIVLTTTTNGEFFHQNVFKITPQVPALAAQGIITLYLSIEQMGRLPERMLCTHFQLYNALDICTN